MLNNLAEIERGRGNYEAARPLHEEAGLRTTTESQRDPVDQAPHAGIEAAARTKLGEARYSALWDEGRALSFEAAVSECLEWFRNEPSDSPPTA